MVKIDKKIKKDRVISALVGAVAGLINGLFGGGGGMIIVPALSLLLKRNAQRSHATAILIILPLSVLSGLFYASFGSFELRVGVPVLIGVTLGGGLGAFLLSKISCKWLVIIFTAVMMGAGVKMLFF